MAQSADIVSQTTLFQVCRGVFQGGGCRGVAYAGAYDAAVKRGVRFSAVAGTSAGSIIAALIGAGVPSEKVLSILSAFNFMNMLGRPVLQDGYSGIAPKTLSILLRCLPSGLARTVGRILRYGGLHSAETLERWVNDQLIEALQLSESPVRFHHLRIPTSVIATDLTSNKAKVWSPDLTPDESVAFAVRCSCSLPFFFQAAVQGDSRFVDGGLLSNLPAFVFAQKDSEQSSEFSDPILAFRLVDGVRAPNEWTPHALGLRMADAIVDGSIHMQLGLNRYVHHIDIDTHGIRATDFKHMTPALSEKLIASGREATDRFISDERAHWSAAKPAIAVYSDIYETFLAIVHESTRPAREIYVLMKDTTWAWKLFPTIVGWLQGKTVIRIAVLPIQGNEDERKKEMHRRATLAAIGVDLQEVALLEYSAFVFCRQNSSANSAIVMDGITDEYKPFTHKYEGAFHSAVVQSLIRDIRALFAGSSAAAIQARLMRTSESHYMFDRLRRGVWQYSSAQVSFRFEEVPLSRVNLIVSKLRAYKYKQVQALITLYQEAGIALFDPALLIAGKYSSMITPPVLEEHGDRMVVIEGNTRVFRCYRQGLKTLGCVVVRGVKETLPGRPVPLDRVTVFAKYIPAAQRLEDFHYGRFRRIEGAMHQPEDESTA